MIDYGLKNKVVLITGANNPQGIGATAALLFARPASKYMKHLDRLHSPKIKSRPLGGLISGGG